MVAFDQKFARLLLEICRYTYAKSFDDASNEKDKLDALDWINKAGAPDAIVMLKDDKKPSTSVACIAAYPDKNIVSYMGTKTQLNTLQNAKETILDWAENLEVLPTPFKLTAEQLGLNQSSDNLGGHVHSGFLEELSAIQAKVVKELLNHDGKNRPVYVTGHSQGGAVAVLATRALLAGGFPVKATYTFAAPRPGDQVFADSIPASLPIYRIEFGNDIVPHVPPTLISRNIQALVEISLLTPSLNDRVKKQLNRLKNKSKGVRFVGVGLLCYGDHENRELRINITPDDETKMFKGRFKKLIANYKHWAEHHHLAGTSIEVSNGVKGNYTALVSEFPMVS